MQKADKKIHKYHPILFTIWAVLKKDGIRVPHHHEIYRRAKFEIEAAGAGVEIADHTGVPWSQHEKNWRDMLPKTRETFARSQILPFFRPAPMKTDMCDNVVSRETMCEHVGQIEDTPETIRELIARSLTSVSIPEDLTARPAPAPAPYPEIDTDNPDMKVLIAARERARRRIDTGQGVFIPDVAGFDVFPKNGG